MNYLSNLMLSIIFIIILSPIIIFISLLILILDGYPIIFKQNRIGKDGKIFKMFKFRSMKKNAEEILKNDKDLYKLYLENDFKIPEEIDTRYISIGSFIRKTSIDEIPQFFNVMAGDMNIVGPRPIVKKELQKYGKLKKYYLAVKPGITGLWQVSGRSNISYKERREIDKNYVKSRSIFLDLKIILKTPLKVIKRDGAF